MTPARLTRLRQLLWLYFWLLIFDGALRKWILPGLSNPLLLVRDPVALLAVVWAWPLLRQRPWWGWLQPLFLIAPVAFLLAITVGHGDIPTALYGCRILVLQLPLIFVFAAVFNRSDVIHFAWVMLLLSIPMTVLIATQSNLPETHFLNVGPGGVGTATFTANVERFRPPGTFTFINGVSSFYTLAAASLFVVLYGTSPRPVGRLLCGVAAIAIVVAVPVSISRSLLAGVLMVLAATLVALALSRTRLVPLISSLLFLVLAFGVATTVPAFQDTADAFVARWDQASAVDREEVGDVGVFANLLTGRVLGNYTRPLGNLDETPLLGYGIGMGTQFGARRLIGDGRWLLGEGAWDASLNELGLPLGLLFTLWRLSLAVWMLRHALRAAATGYRLPLILVGSCFLMVFGGQVSQPTGLGFIVVSAGLTLAAFNPLPVHHSTENRPLPQPASTGLAPSA